MKDMMRGMRAINKNTLQTFKKGLIVSITSLATLLDKNPGILQQQANMSQQQTEEDNYLFTDCATNKIFMQENLFFGNL